MPSAEHMRRARLCAQRLSPGTEAATAEEATAAVCGIQAQDLRAAGLALRSRVPGIAREDIAAADLVRTWTVRGTIHLVAATDLPWLHALTGPRYLARAEQILTRRASLDVARGMLNDLLELIADEPLDRAEMLRRLTDAGHPELHPGPVNLLLPWIAHQGLIRGDTGGRWRAADPPPAVDEDEALATMGRRYLAGYGPATAEDLANWSGLPITVCRRALDAALAPEDADPPAPAPVQLLAGFDTIMLGYRSREPVLAAEHDRRILPGGGMIKAVVLNRGRAVGTWTLPGSGSRRKLDVDWFGPPPAARGLAAEAADVGRFLGVEVTV